VTQLSGVRYLLAALLLAAAMMMAAQALARWRPATGGAGRIGTRLVGLIAPLLAAPTGWRGIGLGLALSALPCGLLYAALAGAAATGSALAGAIVMAAFVLGTVPALGGVALLGRLFLRRGGETVRLVGAGLFALNAVVLAGMAFRLVA
jgi:sulfite exporter TauE/SafE